MTDDVRERVAQAVEAAANAGGCDCWINPAPIADAALSALRPGDVLPGGLMVVPVEPTEAMLDIGDEYAADIVLSTADDIYRAMLAAAKEG